MNALYIGWDCGSFHSFDHTLVLYRTHLLFVLLSSSFSSIKRTNIGCLCVRNTYQLLLVRT